MTHPLQAAVRKATKSNASAVSPGVRVELREVVLKARALELAITGHEHADCLHEADIAVLKDVCRALMTAVEDLQRAVKAPPT